MNQRSAIAAIANRDGRDQQAFLSSTASRWREAGLRIAGVLAEAPTGEGVCSAGFLRDLATSDRFSIQLEAAPAGTSCHLDGSGVERACDALLPQIVTADLVILSKFGKLEAMRQGLWRCFAAAGSASTPLLTTVSSRHREAWSRWAPTAIWLPADEAEVRQWFESLRSPYATAFAGF